MNSNNLVPRELSKSLSRMFQFAGDGAQGLIHPSSNLDGKKETDFCPMTLSGVAKHIKETC